MNKMTSNDVCKKMDEMFHSHEVQTGSEPTYATCVIQFVDDGTTIEDTIKLDTGADEDDDCVFYYCNGLEDLKSLTEHGSGEDFIVVDICDVA